MTSFITWSLQAPAPRRTMMMIRVSSYQCHLKSAQGSLQYRDIPIFLVFSNPSNALVHTCHGVAGSFLLRTHLPLKSADSGSESGLDPETEWGATTLSGKESCSTSSLHSPLQVSLPWLPLHTWQLLLWRPAELASDDWHLAYVAWEWGVIPMDTSKPSSVTSPLACRGKLPLNFLSTRKLIRSRWSWLIICPLDSLMEQGPVIPGPHVMDLLQHSASSFFPCLSLRENQVFPLCPSWLITV